MNRILPPLAIGSLILIGLLLRRRRAHTKTANNLKTATANTIDEVDSRIIDLQKRARKLRGEARQRLQDQAHEMETRQRDIRRRLEELGAEAQKLLHNQA